MKILVIKTSALGDIVHTFPAVQMLHEIYPHAKIDWVVEKSCATLILAHPLVNKVHLVDTKKWRKNFFSSFQEIKKAKALLREDVYDVIFDFQGNTKSGIIMAFSRGKIKVGFGKQSVAEFPNLLFSNLRINPKPGLNIREDYLSLVEEWSGRKKNALSPTLLTLNAEEQSDLKELKIRAATPFSIMVCPGSNWVNKKLPESVLIELLQEIQKKQPCHFWIIQNSLEEMALADRLKMHLSDASILKSLSLPLLQHFMKAMNLVIAMDSLPLHLAGESGVATFSFFGPSLSKKYQPLGAQHLTFQGKCPYQITFTKRCPKLRSCKTGACMQQRCVDKIPSIDYHTLAGEIGKVNSSN